MDGRRAGGPSGLPVPTYALETPKPQSRLGKMRQSLGGSHAAPPLFQADKSMNTSGNQFALTQSAIKSSQSVRRQSTRPPAGPNSLLASAQTPSLAMRTPMRQPAPISMPMSAAPRAILPRAQSVPPEKLLKERAYQSVMLKTINDFLREEGKETVLRVHPTPSAKEFQDTFLFIYNIVFEDDHAPGAKKMDEEVIELLRVVRYPWIDVLAKLSFTIITPHIWPHLLGTLYWMVQLSDYDRNFIEEGKDQNLIDDDNIDEASASQHFDSPQLFRLFLCYLGDVWLDYLAEKDNFSAQRAEFMGIFGARMEDGRLALEENRDIVEQLNNELAELKRNVDEEARLKQDMAELDAKIDHAQELNRGAQIKIQQQMEHSKLLDAEIKTIEERLVQLNRLCSKLVEDVRQQNLSAEEVARMFQDHKSLLKQREDLNNRDLELRSSADGLSISIFNKADEVETLVNDIVAALWSIKLLPKPPAPFQSSDFNIIFNRGTDDLDSMLTGADISNGGDMTKKLGSYADALRTEKADLQSQAVKLESELELSANDLEQLRDQVNETRQEVTVILNELNSAKQVWEEESRASKAHLETMKREIAKIKMANQDRGLELSMRLDNLRLQKKETASKIQRMKGRLIRDLISKAEEIAELKTWTSERLESLTRSAKEDDLSLLSETPADLDTLVQRLRISDGAAH